MNDGTVTERPSTNAEAGEAMRTLCDQGLALRPSAGRTKWEWGGVVESPAAVDVSGMNRVLEHNAADMTVVVEAGARMSEVQAVLAEHGQMLALDPPLGASGAATCGGIVATADSGPLRHRYKSTRDLVLGMTVALSDGTIARSGSKVIKNVAGYDLAKLFCGSFGSLGLITEIIFRLHPLPRDTVTAVGKTDDGESLERASIALSHASLEIESLDVAYGDSSGCVLARFGGIVPADQAKVAGSLMHDEGLEVEIYESDLDVWNVQRSHQRASSGAVVKVSALQTDLARVVEAARSVGASLVGRAGLGIHYIHLDRPEYASDYRRLGGDIEDLRRKLAPRPCVVLDADRATRGKLDVWGAAEGGTLELMRSVKTRFDPAGVCAPGVFVGGI